MAINFEAANMAGYNNPRIEVFVITLNSDTSIATAPSKSEIINCVKRGSIPFLFMVDSEKVTSWLLHLSSINELVSGNCELTFYDISYDSSGTYSSLSIFYPEAADTPPTLNFRELS